MKRTPLYETHRKLGGKLIEFGGWEMPVQYTSIIEEHLAVRKAAGVFDISHMGEVRVNGPGAASFLNQILTNDLRKLEVGQGQYTLMCNESGGVIDDLYAYRLRPDDYLLIINASRIEQDLAWLEQQFAAAGVSNDTRLQNASQELGAIAVQGPLAREFIDQCFVEASSGGTAVAQPSALKKNQVATLPFLGTDIWVSRTGYTGEDGFEVVAPAALIEPVWNRVLELGRPHGLKPAGLGARDTLRTEVCFPLYGHELDEHTTPLEAGLGFFVSLEKGPFPGREILANQRAMGVTKKLIAFKMTSKSAPPRPQYAIYGNDGNKLGEVTSGTQSPCLGIGIGMGYVLPTAAAAQTTIAVEIRGNRVPAAVVSKPIYRKAH